MEEDPFAALDALASRVREGEEEDPFAALAALGSGSGSGPERPSDDISALFEDLEKSASSLSTVLAGFFYEEFGVALSSDDVLEEKGLGAEHLDALQEFLATRVGILFPVGKELNSLEKARFWALVGHVDQLARKQNLNVQEATDQVLVPLESTPVEPLKTAAQKLVDSESNNASATPKTRRKNAVEKGIAKFQGMTLRGRTPEHQKATQKANVQRPTVKSNVILK